LLNISNYFSVTEKFIIIFMDYIILLPVQAPNVEYFDTEILLLDSD